MRIRTTLLMAACGLAMLSCSCSSRLALRAAAAFNNSQAMLELASKGVDISGIRTNVEGRHSLAYMLEANCRSELVDKAVAQGTAFGKNEADYFEWLLRYYEFDRFEAAVKQGARNGGAVAEAAFIKDIGLDYTMADGNLVNFVLIKENGADADAFIERLGFNPRYYRAAATEGDIDRVRKWLSLYGCDKEGLIQIAASGNAEALLACLEKVQTVDIDDLLLCTPSIDHDALISLFPRTSGGFDVDGCIDRMLTDGAYRNAAFLINYRSLLSSDTGRGLEDVRTAEAIAAIGDWISAKEYLGSSQRYDRSDFGLPEDVTEYCRLLGISPYLLLRNEIFARHGYMATNPLLARISLRASWYVPRTNVTAAALNAQEKQNVQFIRNLEDADDLAAIRTWVEDRNYLADEHLFVHESDYHVPPRIAMALSNLGINIAFFLRQEIYARHGYIFDNPALARVFNGIAWYAPSTSDLPVFKDTSGGEGSTEGMNLVLLQYREWLEVLDAQKQHLPSDITALPVLGYNTIYLKEIARPDGVGTVYVSSHSLAWLSTADSRLLEGLPSNMPEEALAPSAELEAKILAIEDPLGKIRTYFEYQPYKGGLDTYLLLNRNPPPPECLRLAVSSYGVNWSTILRKVIHARHGARFGAGTLGESIFAGLSWYSPRYDLVTTTISRLPELAGVNRMETLNFCLLEGADLFSLSRKGAQGYLPRVFDLAGRCYAIRIDKIVENPWEAGSDADFYTALGFDLDITTIEKSLDYWLKNLLGSDGIGPEEEAYYYAGKCG